MAGPQAGNWALRGDVDEVPHPKEGSAMDRLSIYLTFMTGPVLIGGLVIVAFAFGWYGWLPIIASVVIGGALCWPVAYWISRRIKARDPTWDETRVERVDETVPRPGAPEV
jgi:hypothetical protein